MPRGGSAAGTMSDKLATPHFSGLLAPFDLRKTALLRTDVLVIGSGIAGAASALAAAAEGAEVLLITKDDLDATNTAWAQGGIAVVQAAEDSIAQHVDDTLRVGAGIADEFKQMVIDYIEKRFGGAKNAAE